MLLRLFLLKRMLSLFMQKNDIRNLVPLETVPEFYSNTSIKYLSQFEVSMELRLPEGAESLPDPEGVAPAIIFTKGQGTDLAVEKQCHLGPDDVKILVKNFDLTSLRQKFERQATLSLSLKNSSLVKIPITLNCGLKKHEVGKNSKKNRKIKSRQGFIPGPLLHIIRMVNGKSLI